MKVLGLDPGTHLGFAIWDTQRWDFDEIRTLKVHELFWEFEAWRNDGMRPDLVMMEDARRARVGRGAKTFGDVNRLQGVGSVKRDCVILADYFEAIGQPVAMSAPLRKGTKWTAEEFQQRTRWRKSTNEHGRDAAVRVWQLNDSAVAAMIQAWKARR